MCFSCDRKKEAAEPRSITIVKNACFFFPFSFPPHNSLNGLRFPHCIHLCAVVGR